MVVCGGGGRELRGVGGGGRGETQKIRLRKKKMAKCEEVHESLMVACCVPPAQRGAEIINCHSRRGICHCPHPNL